PATTSIAGRHLGPDCLHQGRRQTAPTRQTQNKVQDLGAYPYFGAATAGGIRKHMGHKVMQERERSGARLPPSYVQKMLPQPQATPPHCPFSIFHFPFP